MPKGIYTRTPEMMTGKHMLGRKLSKETKKKIADFHKGNTYSKGRPGWNKGMKNWRKNYKHSEQTKLKIKISNLGKKRSEELKMKLSEIRKANPNRYWLGKKRLDIQGINCHLWKGGVTSESHKIRNSPEYKNWRKQVFERDDYRCLGCGLKNSEQGVKNLILNADHIYPFAPYPRLRFMVENGRTLCVDCHRKTDTYGYKAKKLMANSA